MTTLAHVTALVDAYANRDHARFRAITLQIAAHIEARSESGAAQLRKLVDRQQAMALKPLPSANGLLSAPSDLSSLDDMILAPKIREQLDRIVLEYTQRDVLFVHSLRPARKILFTGIPGVGKSMAAGALARAVGLPLFRVELHGVIQSHMGETAGKLAQVFEHIRAMPAVYLFDEFDAIGADRSSFSDGSAAGAEMRRVVNSLLQFIEDDRSVGLIIAATNHPQVLDAAIFRRFDETITFTAPTWDLLATLVRRSLGDAEATLLDLYAIHAVVAEAAFGHSDVCAALDRVRKDQVLVGTPIDTAGIVIALSQRVSRARPEAAA